MNGIDGQTSGLISRLLKNFLVLHSRRVGVKPTDLQGLAVKGENYLNFFIKCEAGIFLINNCLIFIKKQSKSLKLDETITNYLSKLQS